MVCTVLFSVITVRRLSLIHISCADQKLQYGYQALREVLELGEDVDFLPDEDGKVQSNVTSQIPLTHKNIRGREYYKKDKQ